MQLSFVAGFLDNLEGATNNYLHGLSDPEMATCTIICQAKSREEKLNLLSLLDNFQMPHVVGVENNQTSAATHIISSVFYGAEAYCVLTENIDKTDEEKRKESVENLTTLGSKLIEGLHLFENLEDFKKRFTQEEKHYIPRVNCRLYVDLQPQQFIECSFFDGYNQLLELVKQILAVPNEVAKENSIPVAVQLCPLNVFVHPNHSATRGFTYRQVSWDLVARWTHIFVALKQIVLQAEKMCATHNGSLSREAISEFIRLVTKYHDEKFKENVKKMLVDYRNDGCGYYNSMGRRIREAEDNPLNRFQQWLNLKRNELLVMDWMGSAAGKRITFLPDRNHLEEHLRDKKHVVVLVVPPLDEYSISMLSAMLYRLYQTRKEKKEDEEDPWHFSSPKHKLVLNEIRELATHVEKNEEFTTQVAFFITFGEKIKPFSCNYLIYQSGQLMEDKIRRLPDPPTGLKISLPPAARTAKRAKTCSSSVRVSWDYKDLGFPCHFLLDYRIKGEFDTWIQRRTPKPGQTQLSITVKCGADLEIRVAADTVIGRSDFSNILDTSSRVEEEEIGSILPPTGLNVTSVTTNWAKFKWSMPPEEDSDFWVRVDCCKKGQVSSANSFQEFRYGTTPCRLENLEADTTYVLKVYDMKGKDLNFCPVEFTTRQADRFANKLMDQSEKIGVDLNGMDFLSVPLTKLNGRFKTGDQFVFGKPTVADSRNQIGAQKHRTILLVGSSDSGKTSLINGMANFIFNVDGQDPFRFQLIPDEADDDKINVYDIHHADGFRIPHSLTIINTPNYVDGDSEQNMKVTKLIREFFNDQNAIQEVDKVGFVLNSADYDLPSLQIYIYCSLVSIFGNKIKQDVNFLFSFADDEELPVFEAIDDAVLVTDGQPFHHHKFNNSAVFRSSDDPTDDVGYWDNFQKFFSSLAQETTKSMSVSKQKLDQRKRFESTMEGLKERMLAGAVEFRLLRQMKEKIDCENEELEFKLQVLQVKNALLPFGKYVTNCENCQMTCHAECGTSDNTFHCDVMDHSLPEENRTCQVCPGKCPWNVHRKDLYRLNYEGQLQTTSSRVIKENYEAKLKRKLTLPQLVAVLETDINKKKKELVELVEILLRSARRLDKFLKTKSPLEDSINKTIISVVGQLGQSENKDRSSGFTRRKKILGMLRRIAGGQGTPEELHTLQSGDNLVPFHVFSEEDVGGRRRSKRAGCSGKFKHN